MLLHFKIRATQRRLGSKIEANFALFNSLSNLSRVLFVSELSQNNKVVLTWQVSKSTL